ncbi:MAG: hydrogenase nickel incorporation protein HypB [Chloroflexia bacterium]|nr:hydrogenase nickel incorporation protein HypB [Chloroflexia bacterium]
MNKINIFLRYTFEYFDPKNRIQFFGENKRVVIISVTEGDDKPLKYPQMFHSSDICIINKIDLLPYIDADVKKIREYASQINHHLEFIELSAKTGEGIDNWLNKLKTFMIS